jgi:tRNA 2-thiouridine synthesizing protein A
LILPGNIAEMPPCKRDGARMSRILDVKGLNCPLPVLKAQRAMRDLADGDTLTVLATDPASVIDFKVFCEKKGYELLSVKEEPELFIFEIRKPAVAAAQG